MGFMRFVGAAATGAFFLGLVQPQGLVADAQVVLNNCGLSDGTLKLDNLDLTDDDIDDIKTCIGGLSGLGAGFVEIDLGNNFLNVLPADVFDNVPSSVETLRLDKNGIETLPVGIFQSFNSLTYLNLDENLLTDAGMVVGVFGGLTSLEIMSLQYNYLTVLPAGIFSDFSSTLTRLDLDGNDLLTLPIGLIEGLTALEKLNLDFNPDLACIPAVCAGCNVAIDAPGHLDEALGLGFTCLDPGAVDSLCVLDQGKLDLSSLGLTDGYTDDIKTCLLQLQNAGETITHLALRNNFLENLPTDLFDNAPTLEKLDLYSNNIQTLPAGIFQSLSGLTELDLDKNDLDDAGVYADMFKGLTSLIILGLDDNELTTLPLGILDDFSSSLKFLDLDGNELVRLPDGLIEALTSLETLDLSDNDDLLCLPPTCAGCDLAAIINNAPDHLDEDNPIHICRFGCSLDRFDWIGDGYCDRSPHNSEACGWDGGDCCECDCDPDQEYECGDNDDVGYFCKNPNSECFVPGLGLGSYCVLDDGKLDLQDLGLTDADTDVIKACLLQLQNAGETITKLILGGNNLENLPTDLFDNAPTLEMLSLHDNNIRTLPAGIFQSLSALARLFLGRNKLDVYADMFKGLTSLTRLQLGDNELTTLPLGIFDDFTSSLELLDLTGNEIVRLPDGLIEPLTSLEKLYLRDNLDLLCLPPTCAECDFNDIISAPNHLDEDDPDDVCEYCASDADCTSPKQCCPVKQICEVPESTNPLACGDPHMTGFRGQKFDFTGEDGEWYCLISDLPSMHMNMRVTTPLPSTPEITYITGLSVVTTDGEGLDHSIVIEVTNPHSLESACPDGVKPCLADGALSVFVDGSETLLQPGALAIAQDVTISAANLPGECRTFGFENYWERKKIEYAHATGRRLSAEQSMGAWIVGDPTATNPEECMEYVAKATSRGDKELFAHQSEHASFQIATPTATIRLSHGRLHQLPMRDPTDRFDLPEHLTWQMNIAVDHNDVSMDATGILGETLVPTIDDDGNQIMSGMESIRGSQGDYRVETPLGVHFAQRA